MKVNAAAMLFTSLLLTVACDDKGDGSGDGGSADGTDGSDGTVDTGGGTEAPVDQDHDGWFSDEDCNDNDYRQNPGADELCDGIDNNCDGEVDEGFDADSDGHVSAELCEDGDDCDDSLAGVNPSAEDIPYNGVDEDCDGDDLLDADGDGFDSDDYGGNDCADDDPLAYPGAAEIAKDGVDQDCDGEDLLDEDGDGYDDADFGGLDCNDADATINPGAWDWANDGVDHDCDERDGRRLAAADAPMIWSGSGAASPALFGTTFADCDLDGDGLHDLVVGAPFDSSSGTYYGSVGVYLGANAASWTTGMTLADADVLITGTTTYDFVGFAALCEDLDSDGYDELFIASGQFSYSSRDWTLYRFDGAASWSASMDTTEASATFTYDMNTSSTGTVYSLGLRLWDVDDDGASDQLVFVPSYESSSAEGPVVSEIWVIDTGLLDASAAMEDLSPLVITLDQEDTLYAVYPAPDLNGDGATEMVIGQSDEQLDTDGTTTITPGVLSFLSGVPTTSDTVSNLAWASMEGTGDGDYGGQAAFGDFDGDSTVNAVVAKTGAARGGASDAGAVYLYTDIASDLTGAGLDGESLAEGYLLGEFTDGLLGFRLTTLGDLDNDGSDDLLVVEPNGGISALGRARIVSGALLAAEIGAGTIVSDVQMFEMSGDAASDRLGWTHGVGDFDGDGVNDVLLGARTASSSNGRVYPLLSQWWSSR